MSDSLFIKVAEKDKDLLDKRMFIPSEVKKVAEEAYKKRLGDLNKATFGEVISGMGWQVATAPVSVPMGLFERGFTGGKTEIGRAHV